MAFDAIEKTKKENTKKNKRVFKEIDRIDKVYPLIGLTDNNYVILRIGGRKLYFLPLNTKKYDLVLLDDKQTAEVTDGYWELLRNYQDSVKEIFMNFPERNKKNQEYYQHKIEHSTNLEQQKNLQVELDKLRYIEKTYRKMSSFFGVYGYTEHELEENYNKLKSYNSVFDFTLMDEEEITMMYSLLNNRGGMNEREEE